MDQVELLTAIIEASIALIGFSGVVVILGRRSSGEWFPSDKIRLANLLGIGLITLTCAVVALIFVSAGLSHSAVWALSSLVWLVFLVPFTLWFVRSAIRVRKEPPPPGRSIYRWRFYLGGALTVLLATAGVQAINVAFLTEFWPFFLGLAMLLVLGVVQFIRLLWLGLFQ
jgi:hypothetical protein